MILGSWFGLSRICKCWGTSFFSICFAMHNCYRVFPSANEHQPPLVLKPILTFPKGRNKLHLPMNISPLSFSNPS